VPKTLCFKGRKPSDFGPRSDGHNGWHLKPCPVDHVLHPLDIEVIEAIPISTRVQTDFWAFHFESKGVFSVRSAYRMLVNIKKRRGDWSDEVPGNSNK
jgi:hypothetical protein